MSEGIKVQYHNLENFLEMKKILEQNGFKCTLVQTNGLEVHGTFTPDRGEAHPGEAEDLEQGSVEKEREEFRKENRKLIGL